MKITFYTTGVSIVILMYAVPAVRNANLES